MSYTGSQLGYAVSYLRKHPNTRLVTIDIGANDMFRCQNTTADHCTGADFAQALASVTRNLDTILNALRNQAHYRHDLVVLTYYALNYQNLDLRHPDPGTERRAHRPRRPLRRPPGRRLRRVPRRLRPIRRRHLRGRAAAQAAVRRLRRTPERPRPAGAGGSRTTGHRP